MNSDILDIADISIPNRAVLRWRKFDSDTNNTNEITPLTIFQNGKKKNVRIRVRTRRRVKLRGQWWRLLSFQFVQTCKTLFKKDYYWDYADFYECDARISDRREILSCCLYDYVEHRWAEYAIQISICGCFDMSIILILRKATLHWFTFLHFLVDRNRGQLIIE